MLLGVLFFFILEALAGSCVALDYRWHDGRLPLGWVAVLLDAAWAPAVVLAGLSLLLFPDGRIPSRRWRPLLWIYFGLGVLWLGGAFGISADAIVRHQIRVDSSGALVALNNPAGADAWFGVVQAVFFPVVALCWLAWLTRQALSYRRSSGDRRLQLKWPRRSSGSTPGGGGAIDAGRRGAVQPAAAPGTADCRPEVQPG